MAQFTGTVLWFNNAKGFGFLSHAGGPDVFVHFKVIIKEGYKTIKEGRRVAYDVVKDESGRDHAANVTLIEEVSEKIKRPPFAGTLIFGILLGTKVPSVV